MDAASRNGSTREITPPANEQVRYETRWIPRRSAISNGIVQRERKVLNVVATLVLITAIVAAPEAVAAAPAAIAVEVSEVVAAFEAVVVDVKRNPWGDS